MCVAEGDKRERKREEGVGRTDRRTGESPSSKKQHRSGGRVLQIMCFRKSLFPSQLRLLLRIQLSSLVPVFRFSFL